MPGLPRAPRRWGWLALSALVAACSIAALFVLNDRENHARANEQVALRYMARLDQTISELTPLGGYLSQRNPELLSRLIQTATSVGRSDRVAVQQVDRPRAMQIEALLAELISDAADDSTNLVQAAILTSRARQLAKEIADHERARADRASQFSLYGSAVIVLLALLAVGGLVARERRLSVHAARQHAEELRHLAEHDGLTGLANRRAFEADLHRIRFLPRSQAVEIAVCDLNGLKTVNDRHGHHEGDRLLTGAAHTLRSAVADAGTVYRTGGDEFCVISRPGTSVVSAVHHAMSGCEDRADGSVGIARWPHDSDDVEQVVKLADDRMYEAKRARPGLARARA